MARPRRPRWQAAAGIAAGSLLGWVLVSIGLGLGVPRWTDPDARWLGGLLTGVALLAGLSVVVLAGRAILRAVGPWGWLLLAPWAVVLVIATYSLSIALAAAVPRHPGPDLAAPADLGSRDVEMVTADGVPLAGWYVPSRNGAAVVLRHGSGSTRGDTVPQAAILARAGFGVLMTDARGHGASSGRGMDLGWYGDLDTAAAVDLLAVMPEVDPQRIGVVGLSMGGEEALGAAAADSRIRAVVAEGATGRTAADKSWLPEQYGVAGVLQVQLDRLTYALVDLLSPASPPRTLGDSIARSDAQFLLVAAGEVAHEALVAERLATRAPDRVAVWVVPEVGHVGAATGEPDQWSERVVGFLDDTLAQEAP